MKIKHQQYQYPEQRLEAEKLEASMRQQRLAAEAVAQRIDAFAAATRAGDVDAAFALFADERGGIQRLEMIRALDASEFVDLLRALDGASREVMLASHPNRIDIERELQPEREARYVVITRRVVSGEIAGASGTRPAPLDIATFQRLSRAKAPVRPNREIDLYPRLGGWLEGWRPNDAFLRSTVGNSCAHAMPEAECLARLELDPDFVEQIERGWLHLETKTPTGRRLEDHATVAAAMKGTNRGAVER